jgi:Cdc6-like AAA superfamily ATPase
MCARVSKQPVIDNTRPGRFEWLLLHGLFYSLLFLILGPLTLTAAFYLKRCQIKREAKILLTSTAIFWLLLTPLFFTSMGLLWLYSIPISPLISLLFQGFNDIARLLKPKTLQEHLTAEEQAAKVEDRRLSEKASNVPIPALDVGHLRLGAIIRGDSFATQPGFVQRQGYLCLAEEVLDQHLFLLGTTGAGKSETIKRLVTEILAATNRHIYFVDGKGDEELANDIRSLAHQFDRGTAPVFKLGFDRYGAIYDGFRGTAADIYNRLCALIGIHEAEGDAQYYADGNRDLLQLICYVQSGPPRNFEAVRARLQKEWLLHAYQNNPLELEMIETLSHKEIEGLARRIRPLVREFSPCIGPEGFALEETPCALFSLRVQSVGDTSKRFLDFLVEDLKDFIGKRQQHPSVLIIDEFGQFSNKNITALLSLARSSQLGVILATQDVASLKDETTKKLVLANTRTKLLMATDFPEDVASLAGTFYQIEASIQQQDGGMTGLGSARVQHAFKVDMNEVAQLQPGEAFLIRQRHAAKIKIKAVGKVAHIAEQREEQRRPKPEVSQKRPKLPPKLPPTKRYFASSKALL